MTDVEEIRANPPSLRVALLTRTSDILIGAFILLILTSFLGTYWSIKTQQHERCINALKEPAVADAVRMALCK